MTGLPERSGVGLRSKQRDGLKVHSLSKEQDSGRESQLEVRLTIVDGLISAITRWGTEFGGEFALLKGMFPL